MAPKHPSTYSHCYVKLERNSSGETKLRSKRSTVKFVVVASIVILILCLLRAAGLIFVARTLTQTEKVETLSPSSTKKTCGYDSCTKSAPNKLNIHMVAHTHDDVGWIKTVDQYYFGTHKEIQVAGVQYIIDSFVDALERNPHRKFIYVETAFLWKWWLRQNDEKRMLMRKLINEGRLEIIGGGWSMNDEATTHYQSMIDQYTWGFRRLNDTFGTCARPKIGWQVDPFGHSREQASMFAQMSFDGMLFARLDYQDKKQRLKDKTGEFVWEGSPSLGASSNLFTSMLYNDYSPPKGFCFDVLCGGIEPLIDDEDSPEYNVPRRVDQFLNYVKAQSLHYRTNNVILTMGGDFTYQYADMYFKSLDVLIRQINKRNSTDFYAFYSTPSCYLKALNELNLSWPKKSDDFFPYSSNPHGFWTGYFTSRPTLKYFERLSNNFLQISKQLAVLTNNGDNKDLELYREAMGVMQHHDAITGTERQHVAEDYARMLEHSVERNRVQSNSALHKLTSKKEELKLAKFHSCLLLNISSCEHTENNSRFVITVYNPTSQPINTFVRVPISHGTRPRVRDFKGKKVAMQVVPIPESVQSIPGRFSKAIMELVFHATNISPFGYQMFYVDQGGDVIDVIRGNKPANDTRELNSETYRVSVDSHGRVKVTTKQGVFFNQTFQYYEGAAGNNKVFKNRSSGAYIFRPKQNYSKDLSERGSFQIFKGPLVQEIHQTINNWVSQIIRIYSGQDYIEFDWLVGPIPVTDKIGKEIITKYSSNLKNNGEFYTDSNGREMLKRKFNYRPTWNMSLKEPIAGNYYPVTSKISIKDTEEKLRISALTDRPQGGSSLKEGEIELMIHRRLLNDDALGVGESLNETAYGKGLIARGQHFILAGRLWSSGSLDNIDDLLLREKELAIKLHLRPWIFVTPVTVSSNEWSEYYNMRGDGVMKSLPRNVRILTLEPWKDGQVLLRLEHLFEKGESSKYSVPVTIDLREIFYGFELKNMRETTLGANQWINEMHRLKWKKEEDDNSETNQSSNADNGYIVTIKPMQIKTFILKLAPKSSQRG